MAPQAALGVGTSAHQRVGSGLCRTSPTRSRALSALCGAQRCIVEPSHTSSSEQPEQCTSSFLANHRESAVSAWQWAQAKHLPALAPAGVTLGLFLATSAWPGAAQASEEMLTGQAMEVFAQFLEQVESMGPSGAILFVTVVMLFEMVPLFPTQPLSLASGLLFGAQKGAFLMLIGVTLAAVNAFLVARGVGRPLAQRVIDAEMGHTTDGQAAGTVASTMAQVQAAIDGGGLWKQMTAIALLRLTPVVPFSASNYLLGLTPVQFPAFLGGTLLGMSVWSTVYAGLGGASRKLLDRGADIEVLLADLTNKASALSSSALGLTAGVVGVLAAVYAVRTFTQTQQAGPQGDATSNGNGPSAGAPAKQGAGPGQTEKEAVSSGAGRSSPQRGMRD